MKRTIFTTAWVAAAFSLSFGATEAQLPDPGMTIDSRTALVITDPQNDFLSPEGVTWGVVGQSVTENNTVQNLETLIATDPVVTYGTETIDGLDVFYREAGRPGAPQIVLLHGFPTSSHMFRNAIPLLAHPRP